MSESYSIQFERNKEAASRIYFDKEFRKKAWIQILTALFVFPACLIFAYFFVVAVKVLLGIEGEKFPITEIFAVILALFYTTPFIRPLYLLRKIKKKQLDEMYKSRDIITSICTISEDYFNYKNDYFEYNTTWDNVKSIEINSGNIKIKTIIPVVQIVLPEEKVSKEALEFIKRKIG